MMICGLARRLPDANSAKTARLACLVAATDSLTKPRYVVLLPITHSPPDVGTTPTKVRRAIELDDHSAGLVRADQNQVS
jgi:hypothetical protein